MKKFMKVALMAIVGLFVLVPMVNVHAADGVVEVRTADELYAEAEKSSRHCRKGVHDPEQPIQNGISLRHDRS